MIVHLILNAHLDPVWLWPWQAGLDEVLATCLSACDRLDAHPDIVFTRGEAWVYQQIERVDPELFERIRAHIAAGRWEIVGGWWIQPDCNLPGGLGFERQISVGRQYFEEKFGRFPNIAYNVDSFGHAASLPGYLRAAGQDSYVMMRPQETEMELPARLFRWRGYDGGPEVTTFRIAAAYCCGEMTLEHVQAALTELPPGIEHTMCFVGVGDHGGGPTERQIAWCREHENAIPGCRLVFSSPSRFFQAVAHQHDQLPLVTGELQQHAIGCYSAYRSIKLGVRRAEQLLQRVEEVQKAPDAALRPAIESPERLQEAWQRVCFAHFHDTLGGTSIASAYTPIFDNLGLACTIADEALQYDLRRRLRDLPGEPYQRIVAHNASAVAFDGYLEFEPWLDWNEWEDDWQLLDEDGGGVATQRLHSESLAFRFGNELSEEFGMPRILFRAHIDPNTLKSFRIVPGGGSGSASSMGDIAVSNESIKNAPGIQFLPYESLLFANGLRLPLPRLDLVDDPTDTWSHGLDRYPEAVAQTAEWTEAQVIESGRLRSSLRSEGSIGKSQLQATWRVYRVEKFVELLLTVHWQEKHKVLKLTVELPQPVSQRIDGIPGANLKRTNDGRELPLRDFTLLAGETATLGIVCPDVFAADATPQRVRLTLLRSALIAHHVPHSGHSPSAVFSDQGPQSFRFRFFYDESLSVETLEGHAAMMQRPPLLADLTRGMLPH